MRAVLKKTICILLVIILIFNFMPRASYAEDDSEESEERVFDEEEDMESSLVGKGVDRNCWSSYLGIQTTYCKSFDYSKYNN